MGLVCRSRSAIHASTRGPGRWMRRPTFRGAFVSGRFTPSRRDERRVHRLKRRVAARRGDEVSAAAACPGIPRAYRCSVQSHFIGFADPCTRHGHHVRGARAGDRAARILQRADRRNLLIAGYAYTEGAVPSTFAGGIGTQDLQRGACLCRAPTCGESPPSSTPSCRTPGFPGSAEAAGDRCSAMSAVPPIPGCDCRSTSTGRRREPEEFKEVRAGPDRRREPAGVGAIGSIRREPARRHRHQPLVLQAGGACPRPRVHGRWSSRGGQFFTDNNDFYWGNKTFAGPDLLMQGHVIYAFRSGIWGLVDTTYSLGGARR